MNTNVQPNVAWSALTLEILSEELRAELVALVRERIGAVASLPGASIDGLYVGRLQLFLIYVFIGCMYMVSRYCWKVYCFLHYRVNR